MTGIDVFGVAGPGRDGPSACLSAGGVFCDPLGSVVDNRFAQEPAMGSVNFPFPLSAVSAAASWAN